MAENNAPQNQQDDELSVEELEEAAGGTDVNTNCGGNCGCTLSDTDQAGVGI